MGRDLLVVQLEGYAPIFRFALWPFMAGLESPTQPPRSRPRQYRFPLVLVAAALSVGVGLDAGLDLSPIFLAVLAGLSLPVWGLLFWKRRNHTAQVALLLGIVACGGVLHHRHWHAYRQDEIALAASETRRPIAIEGTVLDAPRLIPAGEPHPFASFTPTDVTKVPLQVTAARDGTQWNSVSGNVSLIVHADELTVRPGDKVRVFCQFSSSAPTLNPGEFDFARYARAQRSLVFCRAHYPECIRVVAAAKGWSARGLLAELRAGVAESLRRVVRPEAYPMAETVLLGRRERLDPAITEAFVETGTVHLLALSGLHLGVLSLLIYRGARLLPLPSWGPPLLLLLFTAGYLLLVDVRAPIVRASILILAIYSGQLLYRGHHFANSLAAAWILVLAINPTSMFQAGPQLSFLAVGTLVWLGTISGRFGSTDPLVVLIRKTRPWPQRMAAWGLEWLKRAYVASLVVWLVTLPLVMLHFQVASPATVLLSPFLMIPLALALISGLGAVVLDVIWPTAASGLGGVMSWLLTWIEWVVFQAHAVSFDPGHVPGPPVWWAAGFYVLVVGGGYLYLGRRCRLPRLVVVAAVWVAIGLGQSLVIDQWRDQRPELRCTFLAVGHGTSVLLELPEGRTILYDCGRLGSPERASEIASAMLLSRGIRHLDAVVLSHEDVDHYNGLPGLMDRISVGVVYASWPMLRDPSSMGERLWDEVERKGIPVKQVAASDRLDLPGGVEISVLHPAGRGVLGSDNANSVVLLIEYAGHRIMLPGDLESPGLEWLLAEQPIPCDVVMAPHHGSQNSHPAAFYPWCQPKWVVVSSGSRVVEGLDAATIQTLDSPPEILSTARDGAVEVVLRADRPPQVTSFRGSVGVAGR